MWSASADRCGAGREDESHRRATVWTGWSGQHSRYDYDIPRRWYRFCWDGPDSVGYSYLRSTATKGYDFRIVRRVILSGDGQAGNQFNHRGRESNFAAYRASTAEHCFV